MARQKNPDAESVSQERLSLPLKDGGLVDWERIRPSTREKFIHIIENDDIPGYESSAADPDAPVPDFGITESNVAMALDALSSLNVIALRMALPRMKRHPFKRMKDPRTGQLVAAPFNVDPDILVAAFRLTPEQHAELDPLGHRLAKKYSGQMPEWLTRNMDLYMFVCMYIKYTGQNAGMAIGRQVKRDLELAQQATVRAQATAPHPVRPIDEMQSNPPNGHDSEPFPVGPQTGMDDDLNAGLAV